MYQALRFRPCKRVLNLARTLVEDIKPNVPNPEGKIPPKATIPKKPVNPPMPPKKKGHGLLYTTIIVAIPCAGLVYYRVSDNAQRLVAEKVPQLENALSFAVPAYHTPACSLHLETLYYIASFFLEVTEKSQTLNVNDVVTMMEKLGFGDCQACKQIRTKSITKLPGETDYTGTMETVANTISSFWWPETVVHEDTPFSINDVVLLLQACMAEKKVTEQEVVNRIRGMNIGQPTQRIKDKMKEAQILFPEVRNYVKVMNEVCDKCSPKVAGNKKSQQQQKKIQQKQKAEVAPAAAASSKAGAAQAPGGKNIPQKVIVAQETPKNKQMYYVGGGAVLVALAAVAYLMGSRNK